MHDSLNIKVCGMTTAQNMAAVAALGVSHLGFISYPKSKRHVAPDALRALSGKVPASVEKVLVTVNESPGQMQAVMEALKPDVLQLHGEESPERCRELRTFAKVWKVIGIGDEADFEKLEQYKGCVDAFLFDTRTPERGGSGRSFDWTLLDQYQHDTPFWLSGGIGPEHATRLMTLRHPKLCGLDLNSRFETSPGFKDRGLLESFIHQLKAHDLSR